MKKRWAAWVLAGGAFVWAVWYGTHRPTAPAPFTFQGTPSAQRLCLSADGRLVAEASRAGKVAVFDTASGTRRCTLTVNAVWMAFSPDGRRLLTRSRGSGPPETDGLVQTWDAAAGKALSVFVAPVGPPGALSSAQPRVAALSADLRWAAVRGPGYCSVFDLTSGRRVKSLPALPFGNTVSFSVDRSLLAVGSDRGPGGLQLWDTRTWRPPNAAGPSAGPVHSVRFSPDGARLAALTASGLSWWDTRPWRHVGGVALPRGVGEEPSYLRFSSDNRHLLVTSTGTSDSVTVVDCMTGRETMTLPNQLVEHASLTGNRVQTIRALPTRILSVSQLLLFRQTYSILDMDRQQEVYRISVPAGPKSPQNSPLGADFQMHESDFSADGHVFAAGGYDDGITHVWHLP